MVVRAGTVVALLAAVTVACGVRPGASTGAAATYPGSIVVIGHSGATGYNSDPRRPLTDAPENSWATGTNPAVDSIYRRILTHNPAIKGHASNLAVDGSGVTDLINQARAAVSHVRAPGLVLVQTVDNDLRCDGTDPQNYKPYAAKLAIALDAIAKGAPGARIFVVGMWATVRNYTNVIKSIPSARAENTGTGPCDVFDGSGKVRAAGVASMERIVAGYHRQVAVTCARFPTCRSDHGAVYRMVTRRADLASDGNHLSVSGQKKMAATVWATLYPR